MRTGTGGTVSTIVDTDALSIETGSPGKQFAGRTCFGRKEDPADRSKFRKRALDLKSNAQNMAHAATELELKGYVLLRASHTKPWKQTIARLQTSEGAVIGISHASLYLSETMKDTFAC